MSVKKVTKKVVKKVVRTTRDTFLPDNYELPKSESYFMKFQEGANRLRILTKATVGWEAWFDGKPKRVEGIDNPFDGATVDVDEKYNRPNMSHFWAFLVWNADEKKIQILQAAQKGVLTGLWTLIQQEEWGDPRNYGIVVTKTVTKGKTEYKVNGVPPKPLSEEIKKALAETDLSIDALFEEGEADDEEPRSVNEKDDF